MFELDRAILRAGHWIRISLLCFVVLASVVRADVTNKQVFMVLYAQINELIMKRNTKAYALFLDPDFEVYFSDGHRRRKDEVIEHFNTYQDRRLRTVVKSVKLFAGMAAVVKCIELYDDGIYLRKTDLWKLTNGLWRLRQTRMEDAGLIRKLKLEDFAD